MVRPPVRDVVWEAVQDFTGGDVNIEFAIQDIKAIILKKYPDFNVNTIGAQIIAQCANSASDRHHPAGMDLIGKLGMAYTEGYPFFTFLSKRLCVYERIPLFLHSRTLILKIVQTLVS